MTLDATFAALQDRYRILGEVGRGGMATVYRAHDLKHDRPVALKVLHDDLAASLGPERFKREILIAARLQHPHILSVFDSGEAAGRLWFTMPFVEGESVRDRLRRNGPLPMEDALRITREAALALAHAHKQGVIHRDIKPENILLTEDGSTLVADFGIARAIGDRSFEQGLTQTGAAVGTPTYMAPEQATGETVLDERVDQYALAAVLYEMLTGQPPFIGTTAAALIAARFTTSVTPARTHRAEVSAETDKALQRALALKPFDRFPTITDFARAVAPNVATPPQFDTLARARMTAPKRRPWLIGAGVLALAMLGGAAALWQRSAQGAAAAGPVRIAVLPLQNLGDAADAYFADGMTDELRAKLVSLPGLQVIASASSNVYAKTDKTPAQIADELGVRYLLTGTLRYEHGANGASTVRVRPELVEVSGNGPATTKWQGAFSEPMTDVPGLQAKIAEQVAAQLQLTLGTTDRTKLAQRPTENAQAYDAYLRAVSRRRSSLSIGDWRAIAADLESAVALDPTFAMAWVELARARTVLAIGQGGTPSLEPLAREAAERARAIAPGQAAAHLGWFHYYNGTDRLEDAERELRAALRLEPNDATNTSRLASLLTQQDRLDEARPLLESSTRLDPLNAGVWANYGTAMLLQRRYAEARRPLERAAVLNPTDLNIVLRRVQMEIGIGDIEAARRLIQDAYRRFTPAQVDVHFATYYENGWLLDSAARERVRTAPREAFDGDPAGQAFVRAQLEHLRGDTTATRRAARVALPLLVAGAATFPDDPQWLFMSAVTAALAGQRVDAERLLQQGIAAEQRARSSLTSRSYHAELRARAYTLLGEPDRAFDAIDQALALPGTLSRGQLSLDPMFAPLRSHPRYRQLMPTASAKEAS